MVERARWPADRAARRLDVKAKSVQGANNERSRGQLVAQQRVILDALLGPDHWAIGGNDLGALGSSIGSIADLQEHLIAAGVVDAILALDVSPQLCASFAKPRRWRKVLVNNG
jgi:hypothetical protein